LIKTEKNFAAFAVEHGTKDAFLRFMDSSAILFSQGKAINGVELYNKREKRSGVLNWQPDYAEISSDGDFGFTSGLWTFQSRTANDTPVASGHFSTVWHVTKIANGNF